MGTLHYTDDRVTLYHGDALATLRGLPSASVHAVVTDPPAGISFMGRHWDGDKGGREQWSAWLAEVMAEALRVTKPGGHALVWALPRTSHWTACGLEDAGWEIRDRVVHLFGTGFPKSHNLDGDWRDWGTALKPAAEDWWLARKPFAGTVAANVEAHGTGALHIGACRVECGRWPPNVLLDESQTHEIDRQSGTRRDGVATNRRRDAADLTGGYEGGWRKPTEDQGYGGEGGASRFFPTFRYEPKAARNERPRVGGVAHPTVKGLDLMRWLVRLVTPPGGTVLDPFAGSGTTAEAAMIEGMDCIAIEREADYLPLIMQRIYRHTNPAAALRQTEDDLGLLDIEETA